MTMRIKLGSFIIEGDSEDELRAAMRVVNDDTAVCNGETLSHVDSVPGPTGTIMDGLLDTTPYGLADLIDVEPTAIPPTIDVGSRLHFDALTPSPPTMIPVRRVLMDVLDVVTLFPEGIPCKGISQLMGVKQATLSHRLGRLKKLGLVESVEHSINWRATALARKAKLVAS